MGVAPLRRRAVARLPTRHVAGILQELGLVQSICAVEGSPTTALNGIFAAQPDCSGAGLSATMTASGQKTYNSGTLASSEVFTLAETISMSDACFTEFVGVSLTDSTCQQVAAQYTSATCTLVLAACECTISSPQNNYATAYSTNGDNTVTEIGSGSLQGAALPYCVFGNQMTQERSLPLGNTEIMYVVTYAHR